MNIMRLTVNSFNEDGRCTSSALVFDERKIKEILAIVDEKPSGRRILAEGDTTPYKLCSVDGFGYEVRRATGTGGRERLIFACAEFTIANAVYSTLVEVHNTSAALYSQKLVNEQPPAVFKP